MVIYLNLWIIESPINSANSNAKPIYTSAGVYIPPINISNLTIGGKLNTTVISETGGIWNSIGTPMYDHARVITLGLNDKTLKAQCTIGTEYDDFDFCPYIGYVINVDTVKSKLNIPIILQYGYWKITGVDNDEESIKPMLKSFDLSLIYQWEDQIEGMLFELI